MPRKKATPTLPAPYSLTPDFALARAAERARLAETKERRQRELDQIKEKYDRELQLHDEEFARIDEDERRHTDDSAAFWRTVNLLERYAVEAPADQPVRPRKPTPSRPVPSGPRWTPAEDARVLAGDPKDDETLASDLGRKGVGGLKRRRTILRQRAAATATAQLEPATVADAIIEEGTRLGIIDALTTDELRSMQTTTAVEPAAAVPPWEPEREVVDEKAWRVPAEDDVQTHVEVAEEMAAEAAAPAPPASASATSPHFPDPVAEPSGEPAASYPPPERAFYRPPKRPPFERVPMPQSREPRPTPQADAATKDPWEPIRQPTEQEKMGRR